MHLSNFGRSWSKIYSSNGTELHNHDGCDHNDHRVFGEIVEVSFEGSDFLTLKLRTDRQGSFVRSEFVILEEGKSLKHQATKESNLNCNKYCFLRLIVSINQSIDQSVNRSIDRLVGQSINQSINHSVSKSVSQSVNQSINQSISNQ